MNGPYAFGAGIVTNRLIGFLPAMFVTGILIYVSDPSIFSVDTIINTKILLINLAKNITQS